MKPSTRAYSAATMARLVPRGLPELRAGARRAFTLILSVAHTDAVLSNLQIPICHYIINFGNESPCLQRFRQLHTQASWSNTPAALQRELSVPVYKKAPINTIHRTSTNSDQLARHFAATPHHMKTDQHAPADIYQNAPDLQPLHVHHCFRPCHLRIRTALVVDGNTTGSKSCLATAPSFRSYNQLP